MKSFRPLILLCLLFNLQTNAQLSGTHAKALDSRCGWFYNQDNEQSFLHDKDGKWLIAKIGEYEAKGNWTPELNRDDKTTFVRTQGLHGYGCVCMQAQTDRGLKRIISVEKISAKKLVDCATDKNLKEPNFTKTAFIQIRNANQLQKDSLEKKISNLDYAGLSQETQKKLFSKATKMFAKKYKNKFTDYGDLEASDFTCEKTGPGFTCERFWPPMQCPEGPSAGAHYTPKNSFYFEIKKKDEIVIDSLEWQTYEDGCR